MSEEIAREILGIDKDTSLTDDILKQAYRRLAKEVHPDKHFGSIEAEAKFKDINEANETLKKILDNPKVCYHLYSERKIIGLRKKYLDNIYNEKYNLKTISFIENKIKLLEKLSHDYEDVSLFDADYQMIESRILMALVKYKKSRMTNLEKDCVIDDVSSNKYKEFCEKILDITNIYEIEHMTHELLNYPKSNNISVINKFFLDAQKSYLIKSYIGDLTNVSEDINAEKEKIENLIVEFFDSVNDNQSVNEFEVNLLIFSLNLEKKLDLLKNKLFDNIIDKSYLESFPYVKVEIFSKLNKIKEHNLRKIYEIYMETKESLVDAIKFNIERHLKKIIEKNKGINNYKMIEKFVNEKYHEIVNSIEIDVNKKLNVDYENELNVFILSYISKYNEMLQQRSLLLKEFDILRLEIKNNEIVNKLKNALEYEELEASIKESSEYIKSLKENKEIKDDKIKKDKKVAIIKGQLSIKVLSRNTYEDDKKRVIASKLEIIFKNYKDGIIDNIDILNDIEFINYEEDLKIIDNLLQNRTEKKQESNIEKKQDDGYKEISEIFKNKEKKERLLQAQQINDLISLRYQSSSMDNADKNKILYYVRDLLNKYVNYEIADISKLSEIKFIDYVEDMDVINSVIGLDNNNSKIRH